jgi:hypothetical protein
MELEAVVNYRGALAHYNVFPETKEIYQALLVRYEGPPEMAPPEHVTLVKSVRHWTGSSDRKELVDEIGYIIEINKSALTSEGKQSPKDFR